MTSSLPFPYSMRHNSKFTLTKREPRISFITTQHKPSSSKPPNQRNILLNYPSDITKLKHQKPFTSLHKSNPKTSSRPKQKKDISTSTPRNNDFLRFFKQTNRRTNISTNRTTTFDFSLETKPTTHKNNITLHNNSQFIKAICKSVHKVNPLHKKQTNHASKNNNNNSNSNKHITSKSKANVIKKKVPAISTYNPFHIGYSKPVFNPSKANTTMNKNAHIMTYQMNIKKLKTGNVGPNKKGNNNSTNVKNKLNITSNQSRSKGHETEVLYKVERMGSSREGGFMEDGSERFDDNFGEDDEEENEEDSGVLAYDDVKDIIVYFDMGNVESKERWLFYKGDVKVFNSEKKEKYMKVWFDGKEEGRKEWKGRSKENKSPSTNDSNTTKNNYISVIKLNNK